MSDLARELRTALLEGSTWVVALVVGTVINAYGQLLVPWLRGADDLCAQIEDHWERTPGLLVLSVALGYLFPLAVGTWSAARTRHQRRKDE